MTRRKIKTGEHLVEERRGAVDDDFLANRVYTFDGELRAPFEMICSLEPVKAKIDEIGLAAFRLGLGEILYRHRNRHQADHVADLKSAASAAEQAADAIKNTMPMFTRLEMDQKALVYHMIRKMNFNFATKFPDALELSLIKAFTVGHIPEVTLQLNLILMHLKRSEAVLRVLASVVRGTNERDWESGGRGRKSLPFVLATWEIIDFWEEVIGQKIVSPKGMAKGRSGTFEAQQTSTEFVRCALQIINPRVTASQAITSVKNALKARVNIDQVRQAAGESASLMDLIKTYR